MAHFYGQLAWGEAKTVTRTGSKGFGIGAYVQGNNLGAHVSMRHFEGVDTAHIQVSNGRYGSPSPLMSCVREGERIICTINPYISDTIIIK